MPAHFRRHERCIIAMFGLAFLFFVALPSLGSDYPERLRISEHAQWSPDGRHIVFMSSRDGNSEIYVMERDGSGVKRLTENPQTDIFPSSSPDGTRIVYASNSIAWEHSTVPASTLSIFVMDRGGANKKQLTNLIGEDWGAPVALVRDTYPFWHPDGERIGFVSSRANRFMEIFSMSPSGGDVERLTFHQSHHWNPQWAPGGEFIVYDGRMDGGNTPTRDGEWGIQRARAPAAGDSASGGYVEETFVNGSEADEYNAAFAPDGSYVLYLKAGEAGVWKRDLARGGADVLFLTMNEGNMFDLVISPDGRAVAFTSSRDGHYEIYSMDLSTRVSRRLTFSR